MRNTALITKANSMFSLRTVSCGHQTVFTKQLSKLYSPLQPHSVSNKLIYSRGNYLLLKGACPLYTSTQQLQQKSPQKQQKPQFPQQGEGFVHDFDEEVEILSHTHSDIGWVGSEQFNRHLFCHLLCCFRSFFNKQCRPRSDCSSRSSLFWFLNCLPI